MARPKTRRGTVAFARIDFERPKGPKGQETVFDVGDELVKSLVPGTVNERYERVWRIAQWARDGDWIIGRIGYEQLGQRELWDDEKKDYIERASVQAQTVPYAINVPALRVSFQLRARRVNPVTFQGNFRALLNKASPYLRWKVILEGVEEPSWEEWQEEVERITKVTVQMVRPNPRYRGNQVKDLFEKSKAAAITMVVQAPKGETIDPDGPDFLRQAIEHAEDYGHLSATGTKIEDGQEVSVPWTSEPEGEVEKKRVLADPETGEVPPETLRETLASELPPESQGT